jgi:hypothetical protein
MKWRIEGMTFREFSKQNKLTPQEKRLALFFLIALRLGRMWDTLMGDDDE